MQYIEAESDSCDSNNGHGTHVAGTSVGFAFNDDDSAATSNGVAPGAKLAFYDAQNYALYVGSGALQFPANVGGGFAEDEGTSGLGWAGQGRAEEIRPGLPPAVKEIGRAHV